MLTEFKQLFDGTLGDWETSPARIELRQIYSPHHGRAYQIPKIYQDIFWKEVDRLEKLEVSKQEIDSEWGSPASIVSKKQGTVLFLTDFLEE